MSGVRDPLHTGAPAGSDNGVLRGRLRRLLSLSKTCCGGDAMNNCPLPIGDYPNILLAHGGGGKLMHQLIEGLMIPAFTNGSPFQRHDGAIVAFGNTRLAFTTDSYVVHPLFFPG